MARVGTFESTFFLVIWLPCPNKSIKSRPGLVLNRQIARRRASGATSGVELWKGRCCILTEHGIPCSLRTAQLLKTLCRLDVNTKQCAMATQRMVDWRTTESLKGKILRRTMGSGGSGSERLSLRWRR